MLAVFHRRGLIVPAVAASAVLLAAAHGAAAQAATGTVTGRVVWGACLRSIPLPVAPNAQAEDQAQQPAPTVSGLPAGAVLVAIQNTAISGRTDEAGRFSLAGVPAGQYMTIAAGPVADSIVAIAARPNVYVDGGQRVDVGTLSLGGAPAGGIGCRGLPGLSVPNVSTQPGTAPTPPGDAGSSSP
jgi:hypothetical protein